MKILNYTVLFEPIEEGGYMVVVPALPGIVTFGKDLEEARVMAADAIKCHCEGLLKDGESLPDDKKLTLEPVKEKITVQLGYA
jgi:antitoxin HicB